MILIESTCYIIVHKLYNKIFICWWCTVQTWRPSGRYAGGPTEATIICWHSNLCEIFLSSCLEQLLSFIYIYIYIFSHFHWKILADFWSVTYLRKAKYKINLEINFYYTKWQIVETYGMNVDSFHMFLHTYIHTHTYT